MNTITVTDEELSTITFSLDLRAMSTYDEGLTDVALNLANLAQSLRERAVA